MSYDLIIRGGMIVDGSGLPGYQGDLGIKDGRIASIGKVAGSADEVIEAEGHVVAPGFIDAHTHMDAQIFWDPLGTSSCWHGVTSVLMGNCGFTLAPCAEQNKRLVLRNLERAEDISAAAMEAGIQWSWETFPEYLDAIDRLPKGINYGVYAGHSALRTYAMGERAFTEEASPDDLAAMKRELGAAMKAGAAGFTTTRSRSHMTPDGGPVASRVASWDEVRALVGVLGELKAGVFELEKEEIHTPELQRDFFGRLKALAVETNVPISFGVVDRPDAPWRAYYDLVDDTVAAGGRMLVQGSGLMGSILLSFETALPFDKAPVWSEFRTLPLAEQEASLRKPEVRAQLTRAVLDYLAKFDSAGSAKGPMTAETRPVGFDKLFVFEKPLPPYRSIAEIARESGKEPLDVMIDLALEKHLKQFFLQPLVDQDPDVVLAMLRHPRTAVTFSDSGAHVSQIIQSSIQSHLLAYWVRERQALTLEQAIRKITFDIASYWGLRGRGLLREGAFADVVVFDPQNITPQMPMLAHDLPAGARRLTQKSAGIKTTIVNGKVLMRDSEHSGALPGKLLRGPLAKPA